MISEEDKERIELAQHCNNCVEWHEQCNAECCKTIFLNISPDELDTTKSYIEVLKVCTKDMKWYYKLRGVQYIHGVLRFPKKYCNIVGNRIIYVRRCMMLDEDNLCSGHPDNKPELCKYLTLETSVDSKGCEVTPNCLFKYKVQEEENV